MFFNTSRLQLKLYIFYIQTVQIGQYSKVNEHDSKTKFLDGKQKKLAHQKKRIIMILMAYLSIRQVRFLF